MYEQFRARDATDKCFAKYKIVLCPFNHEENVIIFSG